MMGRLSAACDFARRHSIAWNLVRNFGHILHRRRVSPSAWLIMDGSFAFGTGATISGGCRLTVPTGAHLDIGAQVWLARDVEIDVLTRIAIGAGSTLQRNGTVIGDVSIGRGCVIAPNFFASSGRHYFDRWPELPIRVQDGRVALNANMSLTHSQRIVVEDDCWIGANAVVMPGVRIGRGAIVGANSVVTHDVGPYSVAAGSPARVLRPRLEYRPKRGLDGTREPDLPYFHAGFVLDGNLPPVADGSFDIVLDCTDAAQVALKVRNLIAAPTSISHGATRRDIDAGGTTEVAFSVDPGAIASGHCCFTVPAGARLEILMARVHSNNDL